MKPSTPQTELAPSAQLRKAVFGGSHINYPEHHGGCRLAVIFLLVTALCRVSAIASCLPAPSGLVNFWPGDGNAKDLVGTYNGTLLGGTTFASGEVGTAFSFDGINDTVQIGGTPIPAPWAAEFWVNRQASPQDSAVLLGDTNTALKLEQYQNTKQVGFTKWGVTDYYFNYTAPTGTWVHLVFVATTTNIKLYVNGAIRDTNNTTMALPRGQMGNDISGRYNKPLKGLLDEVSLYNRALSASEIASLFAAGAAGKCKPPTNDNFVNRIQLPSTTNSFSFTSSNLGATFETGETNFLGNSYGGRSVWYSYTNLGPGLVRFLLSDPPLQCYDATYGLFFARGSSVSNLTAVAAPIIIDNGSLQCRYRTLYADVVPVLEYQLAVDGATTNSGIFTGGDFSVNVQFTASPGNDNFEQRSNILGNEYSAPIQLLAASRQSGEPSHGGGAGSLWWGWTAPFNGLATLRGTQPGNFVPLLAVYQGSLLTNLSTVTSTNEVVGHTRQLRFQAVQGQTYALALAGAKYDTNAFPHIGDDVYGYGRFDFNFATLGIRITNLVATTNGANGVDFSATARVEHFGSVTTGPLRFRLIARQGLSKAEKGSASNVLLQVELGIFTLPPPGQVAPGLSGPVSVSGTCPAPEGPGDFGFGWEVFCLLEEQAGTNWLLQDKLLVLQGVWPIVGGYGGPGGGVIRLDPGLNGLESVELISVNILGPPVVPEGSQGTYVGLAGYSDGSTLIYSNTVWTASRFSITNGVFTAGSVTSNTPVTLTNQYSLGGNSYPAVTNIVVSNLPPPMFKAPVTASGGNFVLQLEGVANRKHVIESTTNLSASTVWTPVFTNFAGTNGLLNFTNSIGTNRQRFFRGREAE